MMLLYNIIVSIRHLPMLQPIIQAVPVHIISGFLGAGKTTLLNHLLQQKPAGETWAVLMNEFGKIGVDQALIEQTDGIAIKEVLGGCLCCTSQLPTQIALSRLLIQAKPDRLFIEPTGLGHPDQLLDQLSEPHWAKALSMRAVLTVVNGQALGDPRLLQHETFAVQVQTADIVLISNQDCMTEQNLQQLEQFKQKFIQPIQQIKLMQQGQVDFALLDQPHRTRHLQKRSLLHKPTTVVPVNNTESTDLPYHYIERAVGHEVAGWRLPENWQFDRHQLLNCLFDVQGWLRIKGVIHLEDEWISLNLTPYQIGMSSREPFTDNRLEIISEQPQDWEQIERQLMSCIKDGSKAS